MRCQSGYSALRRGRYSAPGFSYFLTICVADRSAVLTVPPIGAASQTEIQLISDAGAWRVHAFTLMPDHLHLVVELGGRLSLSQAVGRLKSKTRPALTAGHARWQQGYFDHRLKTDDSLLPVLLYVYLNPYRKGLVKVTERWPWFYCHADDWTWFKHHLADDLPEPEWMR